MVQLVQQILVVAVEVAVLQLLHKLLALVLQVVQELLY
jgi:hypothetical protein